MFIVYRYRVKGKSAARRLNASKLAVNEVWNWSNDTQRQAVRSGRRWLSGFDLNYLSAGASKEMGLSSETIQSVCERYAFSRSQQKKRWLRYRGGRAPGWVPFKATAVKLTSKGFRFQKHLYRVWLSRPLRGRIKCGSFAQDSRGRWYINLCIDTPTTADCGNGEIGVDLGLKTTAAMSDGQKYDGLRAFRAVEDALSKAQRAHNKKKVRTLHAKAKNRRLDGLHKLSTQLVRDNKLVVVGDVSSTKLAKTKMAKSVYDAGWGLLKGMLRYKTLARGAVYREVDEYLSSQLCSNCGSLPDSRPTGIAQLRIREWVCTDCGQGHDRDINAARNILALGCQRPVEGILAL